MEIKCGKTPDGRVCVENTPELQALKKACEMTGQDVIKVLAEKLGVNDFAIETGWRQNNSN